MNPIVRLLVGWSVVGLSLVSKKSGKLYLHAPLSALFMYYFRDQDSGREAVAEADHIRGRGRGELEHQDA